MKTRKLFYVFALAIACVFAMIACGGLNQTVGNATDIRVTESLEIAVGESGTVRVWTTPSGEDVAWSLSKEGVVTMSNASKNSVTVTGVAAGTVKVTAKSGKVSASCDVTVNNVEITLDKETVTLNVTEARKTKITATVTGTNNKPAWTSDNEGVATVDANGWVTARGNGTANIKATVGTVEKACAVSVVAPQDYYLIESGTNDKVIQSAGTWFYQQSNESTAVDAYYHSSKAFLEANNLGAGIDTYLVYQPDFIEGTPVDISFKITIDKAAFIRLSGMVSTPVVSGSILEPGTYTVKNAAEEGDDATTIYVGDAKVGKKPWAISLLGEDQASLSGTFKVTISDFVAAPQFFLTASSTRINLTEEDKTAQISAHYYPEGATLSYESSDTEVATVDNQGVVTGLTEGTAKITVTYTKGSESGTATINITVYQGPSSEYKVTWSQTVFNNPEDGKFYQNGYKYDSIAMVDGVITLTINNQKTFNDIQQIRVAPVDEEGNAIIKYRLYLTLTNNTDRNLRYMGNVNGLTAPPWQTLEVGNTVYIMYEADTTNGTDRKQFNFKLTDYGVGTVVISEIYIVPIV